MPLEPGETNTYDDAQAAQATSAAQTYDDGAVAAAVPDDDALLGFSAVDVLDEPLRVAGGAPPPAPSLLLGEDVDAPEPGFLPFGRFNVVVYVVLVVAVVRCVHRKYPRQTLKLAACMLDMVGLILPALAKHAAILRQRAEHQPILPVEDANIVWTNESIETGRVDGSAVDEFGEDDELAGPHRSHGGGPNGLGADNDEVEDVDDDDDDEVLAVTDEDDEEGSPNGASMARQRAGGRSRKQRAKPPKPGKQSKRAAKEHPTGCHSGGSAESWQDVEDAGDSDEVQEVDEEEDYDEGTGRGGSSSGGTRSESSAMAAMQARLDELETKLAGGAIHGRSHGRSSLTLNELQGSAQSRAMAGRGGSGQDEDSFTMVGLPAQVKRAQQAPCCIGELRQQRLEESLRSKREKAAVQTAMKDEGLKAESRCKLRSKLLFIDHELDALASRAPEQGSPPSQLIAAKWLLEHAYVQYPPPGFTKRRAEEEAKRARQLRFRDATIAALKVLQGRYAPDKNSVALVGADRAVLADEIVKHAFSIAAGIARGSRQELPPGMVGSFDRRMSGAGPEGDEIGYSLTAAGEVEDAD